MAKQLGHFVEAPAGIDDVAPERVPELVWRDGLAQAGAS